MSKEIKIRILHVFSIMNRGGAETLIMDLYRKVDRNKFEFHFVVHTNEIGTFDEEIRNLGGRIYRVPKFTGVNHVSYVKRWSEILDDNLHFDIIHGHVRSTASIYLQIAKKKGIKTVSHSHNTSNGRNFSSVIKKLFQVRIRNIADYFLAPSEAAGEWLFGRKVVESNRFTILKNGINSEKFKFNAQKRQQIRNQLKIESDSIVIGHVGNFKLQKNHSYLIELFEQLNKQNEKYVLMLIGDGDEREKIESEILALNIAEKVLMLGDRNDVSNLMQGMDIFLFPSFFEGLGIVAIEAQASGLPTITSMGVPEEACVTNLIKRISLDKGIEYWADTVVNLDKQGERRDMSSEIRENGYDINEVCSQLLSIYTTLLN